MDDTRKPWLLPLARLATIVVAISLLGMFASIGYVVQRPAEEGEALINPFSGRVMHPKANKFKTEPLSWVAIGLGIIGTGAGVTREWAIRRRREIDTQLERMGVFPPPSRSFISRLLGRG